MVIQYYCNQLVYAYFDVCAIHQISVFLYGVFQQALLLMFLM